MKHIKLFENFDINEAKKEIVPYAEVKVGDTAMQNPDAGGEWNNKVGKVLWKGTYKELLKTKYKDTAEDWEMEDEEEWDGFDLIVIQTLGWDSNAVLFNYNNDPSGCVVFKK